MDGETTLNIVDQTEVLASLFDGDNICWGCGKHGGL